MTRQQLFDAIDSLDGNGINCTDDNLLKAAINEMDLDGDLLDFDEDEECDVCGLDADDCECECEDSDIPL